MKNRFVHLHVHTEYSLLDGLSNIKKLLRYIKENEMDSLAITDHGAMYGVIEFYKAAKAMEVQPIIGMEGYTTNLKLGEKEEKQKVRNYHLLYLAKNLEGYKNLLKISSIAHLEGYYYRPRIDKETLKKYSRGLICTSACPQGEIARALIEDNYQAAKKTALWFLDVFGDDYYLEIQRHDYEENIQQIKDSNLINDLKQMTKNASIIEKGTLSLSHDLGIPLVATNDSHYIKKEDAMAQDALVCIATGKTIDDSKRLRFIDYPSFYVRTPTEMETLFSDIPEAISNTVKIASRCQLEISLGKWFFPKFSLPKNIKADKYLEKIARERLKEKIHKLTKEVQERLDYELTIINQKGYAPYFLIVMDIVNWANEKGIVTNTRGSVAGSLVSYVLGITTVNPITYYLPFERFLNPYRPSPPDIDLDVADKRRDEIIDYICQKYGQEKVAQICTFGRMLSRAAVRDVARVLGYPYAIGDRIAKLIPPPKQGFPVTIPKALEEVGELNKLYEEDKDAHKILDLAKEIEGNARHISVHAAGLVIAPSNLIDFCPIQKEPSGEKIITQYEFHTCEDVGLIKFDILGIRNLSILGSALEILHDSRKIDIDLHEIPFNDKKTFAMLGRGETIGTFQMSGSGMTKYLKELKPTRVEDLMAMVALYRPGPIAVIPEYIKRKRNPKLVKYLDPRMRKFLEASYGLIVYQDDLLFCALELAGYSWEEADKFRKAVGKKIPEEMAAQKEKFFKGVVKSGQTKKFAENLWSLFEPFQAYGFNKAHAASYGIIAYQTAYMKANYPVEFMTALLSAESSDGEKVSLAINECRKMGIAILPPDINASNEDFIIVSSQDSLEQKAIRFGLNAVKNVGKAAIEAIQEGRKAGIFRSLPDFVTRVDGRRVNKKVLESLINVGALGTFGSRQTLIADLENIRQKYSRKKNDNQPQLFTQDEADYDIQIRSSITAEEEYSQEEIQKLERELLGFSLSAKPIDEIIGALKTAATHKLIDLVDENLQNRVTVAGVIKELRVILTKKTGQEMAFAKIEDATGTAEVVVFPGVFSLTKDYLIEQKPVLITGKIDRREDTVSIIADEINLEAENKEKSFLIKIPNETTAKQLKKLKALLLENPGDCRTSLLFENSEAKIDLPYKVNWNPNLTGLISQLLGVDLSS